MATPTLDDLPTLVPIFTDATDAAELDAEQIADAAAALMPAFAAYCSIAHNRRFCPKPPAEAVRLAIFTAQVAWAVASVE